MALDHDGTLVQQGMQPVPPGNNQDINPVSDIYYTAYVVASNSILGKSGS